MSETSHDPSARILSSALHLAARLGNWRAVTLAGVAEEAGVTLAQVYRHFPTRHDLLTGLSRHIDVQVLDQLAAAGTKETPRDRLFEIIMRRFDALAPFRPGLKAIMADVPEGIAALAGTGGQFARSMAWTLEAAGLASHGALGGLRVAGLSALYLRVFQVWLGDDSADLSATMAELDRLLKHAESWAGGMMRRRGDDAAAAQGNTQEA